jgi:glycosyltransferase involved in cell wall biosynthesis
MMCERKPKVLWCGEASFLNTGYSIYTQQVLSRLHETGKYEIAEFACYASHDSAEAEGTPWKIYPNLPDSSEEEGQYSSNPRNQFGEWRFNDVCLDFRPDIVVDIRDWWMIEYQERSPFRKLYTWAIMPTVDSYPQQEQYLYTYSMADAVFTYSEFGKEVIESQTHNKIRVKAVASPAADYEKLKPSQNKEEHRQKFGFMPEINVVGTIMRNQRRKLYPNLISSFRKMLDDSPELQQNTFLYLHTSYPDIGWDIPYFIKKYNMGNHTLMTYKCKACSSFFPSFYSGVKIPCPVCGGFPATLPNTNFGVTTEELSAIINFFDLYVQYSICEGFGMPQVEAAACGVPVITVNYSAMKSVGEKIKADFVDVKSLFWETATQSQRAIPDDEQLTDKMRKFLKLPKSMRIKKGMDSYIRVKQSYNWDKTAESWEQYIDSVEIKPHSETWDSESRAFFPTNEIPENIENSEFVEWLMTNVFGEPDKTNGYIALRILRDLNRGQHPVDDNGIHYDELSSMSLGKPQKPFDKKTAAATVFGMLEEKNFWEKKREEVSLAGGWSLENVPNFIKNINHKNQEAFL